MTKDQVIFLREKIRAANVGITVYSDNMIISQEHVDDAAFLEWDDNRELLYNIKSNRHPDHKEQKKYPITVQASSYDTIQYMGNSMDLIGFSKFLDSLITDGVITNDDKADIIMKFTDETIL